MTLSERPYLSIGEVLAMLLDEFPDVTISKIRFLESQGLIDPERTPSGYRKFYDPDVDRLRVILREQRENYLPLRVIRDRLESGEIDETGGNGTPRAARDENDSETDGEAGRPTAASGHRETAGGASRDGVDSAASSSTRPPAGRDADLGADLDDDTDDLEMPDDVETNRHPAAQRRPAPAPPTAPRAADFFAPGGEVPPSMLPVERTEYTVGDMCALTRLTPRQLGELESYGIVTPVGTGTSALYSPLDLEVATVAARFMERGIDARHLRAWKQAAEREAALFEQLIAPLLRQRNPQSRQKAAELLVELAATGGELRAVLLRGALGQHLEP